MEESVLAYTLSNCLMVHAEKWDSKLEK